MTVVVLLLAFLFSSSFSFATEFTSTNFKVLDPVFHPGGFSSSNNFRMFGSFHQPVTGISTSNDSTLNTLKAGFLYFPAPTVAEEEEEEAAAPDPGGGGPVLGLFQDFLVRLIVRCKKSDLNCDGLVNIYDAGILFYWWNKPIDKPNFVTLIANILGLGRPSPDINSDTSVDIYDLSILLADWSRE